MLKGFSQILKGFDSICDGFISIFTLGGNPINYNDYVFDEEKQQQAQIDAWNKLAKALNDAIAFERERLAKETADKTN